MYTNDQTIFQMFNNLQIWAVAYKSESKHFWHLDPILHAGRVEGNAIFFLSTLRALYFLFNVSIINLKSMIAVGILLMYCKQM